MKTISKEITFRSADFSASDCIAKVSIDFTDSLLGDIKSCLSIMEDNKHIRSITVDVYGIHLDDEGNKTNEWRCDVEYLIIYSGGGVYYYAQNKWDAADQIESDCFTLEELFNEV